MATSKGQKQVWADRTDEERRRIARRISRSKRGQKLGPASEERKRKASEAQKGQTKEWGVKSCGKRHPYCKGCRPDIGRKVRKAKKGVSVGQPANRRKPTCRSCGGPHLFTKACNPEVAARRAGRTRRTLRRQGKTGLSQGYRFTEEQKVKLAAAKKASLRSREQFQAYQAKGQAAARWSRHQPTRIHRELAAFLEGAGFRVELEQRFGSYSVDCYLPERHLALEADGNRWHKGRQQRWKDRRRDSQLLAEHGLPVVRLDEEDIEALSG